MPRVLLANARAQLAAGRLQVSDAALMLEPWSATQYQQTALYLPGAMSKAQLAIATQDYGAFSVETAVRATGLAAAYAAGQAYSNLVYHSENLLLLDFQMLMPGATPLLCFQLVTSAGQVQLACSIDLAYFDGHDVRVSATWDGTTKRLFVRRPGEAIIELTGSGAAQGGVLTLNNSPTYVGETQYATDNLVGYAYDLRYWDYARSPAQLNQYAFRTLPQPTRPGLVANYLFGDVAGTTAPVDTTTISPPAMLLGGAAIVSYATPLALS